MRTTNHNKKELIKTHGYVVVRNVLSTDEIKRLRKDESRVNRGVRCPED
ncbi:hypothetical protein [Crocosphaera sp. XPORK-15E]|nr:hypothetical protein [Crocosphaera sp. XPORK-15E]MEA5534778.1 hypothetical protein [Crocosphaera sp. XPORK-15E]